MTTTNFLEDRHIKSIATEEIGQGESQGYLTVYRYIP